MSDRIIRGVTEDGFVRFYGLDFKDLMIKAQEIHNLSTTNSVIFGRLLGAGLIMGSDLKSDKDLITIRVNSDGIANGTIVTANGRGEIKGFVPKPKVELPLKDGVIDVKSGVGEGTLTIIKDLGLKNPYNGTVELLYGEIAADITHYYTQSEQIPTAMGLGVLVFPNGEIKQAGGFMIQLLPGADESIIKKIEDNLMRFPNLTDMLDIGHSIEDLIKTYILKGMNPTIKNSSSVEYKCDCSRERFSRVLATLGKFELEEAIEDQGEIEVNCHFCNSRYKYDKAFVKSIIDNM